MWKLKEGEGEKLRRPHLRFGRVSYTVQALDGVRAKISPRPQLLAQALWGQSFMETWAKASATTPVNTILMYNNITQAQYLYVKIWWTEVEQSQQ